MDFQKVNILPELTLTELEENVELKQDRIVYTDIERSEAYEALGIAQYYNGDYLKAYDNLNASIDPLYIKMKSRKRLAHTKTILGLLTYRLGDIGQSEQFFNAAAEHCKKLHNHALHALVLSNLALVKLRTGHTNDALRSAKLSIDIAQKVYQRESEEYLQFLRILVSVYLKLEEFSKAENVLEESELPYKEKVLISAGIKFATGDYAASVDILTKAKESEVRIKEMLLQKQREKEREEQEQELLAAAAGSESEDVTGESTPAAVPGSAGSDGGTRPAATAAAAETHDTSAAAASANASGGTGIAFPPPLTVSLPAADPLSPSSNPQTPTTVASPGGTAAATANSSSSGGGKTPKLKRKNTAHLLPIVKTYADDYNDQILSAMMQYNVSMMKSTSHYEALGLEPTIEKLEVFLQELHARRQRVNKTAMRVHYSNARRPAHLGAAPLHRDDPYLYLDHNKHPPYMPLDTYLLPAVALSSILTAKAEFNLLTTPLQVGLGIETGHMDGDVPELGDAFKEAQETFAQSLRVLQSSLPEVVVEAAFNGKASPLVFSSSPTAGASGSSSLVSGPSGGISAPSSSLLDEGEGADTLGFEADNETPMASNPLTPTSRMGTGKSSRNSKKEMMLSASAKIQAAMPSMFPVVEIDLDAANKAALQRAASSTSLGETKLPPITTEALADLQYVNNTMSRYQELSEVATSQAGAVLTATTALQRLHEEHTIFVASQTGELREKPDWSSMAFSGGGSRNASRNASRGATPAGTGGREKGRKLHKQATAGSASASLSVDDSTANAPNSDNNSTSVASAGTSTAAGTGTAGSETSKGKASKGGRKKKKKAGKEDANEKDRATSAPEVEAEPEVNIASLVGATMKQEELFGDIACYNHNKLTDSTFQSEMLPLLQNLGKDAATSWIEWALSRTGPFSFGFLGQSCLDPLPDVGFNLARFAGEQPHHSVSKPGSGGGGSAGHPPEHTGAHAEHKDGGGSGGEGGGGGVDEAAGEVSVAESSGPSIDAAGAADAHSITGTGSSAAGSKPNSAPHSEHEEGHVSHHNHHSHLLDSWDKGPSKKFLLEVRSRLLELETALAQQDETRKVTNVRGEAKLEARILNFFLLSKVTVQLDMKKEAGQAILFLEEACGNLMKQQCESVDSLTYSALALRYRLDYEEWSISSLVSEAWLLSHLANKILPMGKQYVALTKKLGDVHLQRDALKRLINIYADISAIPSQDPNINTNVPSMTQQACLALTEEEIEVDETTGAHLVWLQKHGGFRGLALWEEMRRLGEQVVGTTADSGGIKPSTSNTALNEAAAAGGGGIKPSTSNTALNEAVNIHSQILNAT